MADIQVLSPINSATKILPKARQRIPQLQEAGRQEDIRRSQILQECRVGVQDTQGGHWGSLRRQEVPLHRQGLHQRQNPQGPRDLHQDAENHHREKRLPPLRQQVQQVREEAHQHPSPHLPRLLSEGGRHRCDRANQTLVQDREIQCLEGHSQRDHRKRQEAIRLILIWSIFKMKCELSFIKQKIVCYSQFLLIF